MSLESLDCPTSPYVPVGPAPSTWSGLGMRVQHDYIVMSGAVNGGSTVPGGGSGSKRWIPFGFAAPAVSLSDELLSKAIVAADRVELDQNAGKPWSNHDGGLTDNPRPVFQNVSFGDTHVEGYGKAQYNSDITSGNATYGGVNHAPDYLWGKVYWGTP